MIYKNLFLELNNVTFLKSQHEARHKTSRTNESQYSHTLSSKDLKTFYFHVETNKPMLCVQFYMNQ